MRRSGCVLSTRTCGNELSAQSYRLTQQNRQRLLEFLGRLDVSRDWVVTVEPYIKKRTNTQNARLWKLHSLAAEVTGYSAEEMHEFCLCRFYGAEEVKIGGIIRQIPLKRSSTRNVKEFGEFMEQTEAFYISELGVWLDADVRQEDMPRRAA